MLSITSVSSVGLLVTVTRHDAAGSHTVGTTATKTGGVWAITDVPPNAGTVTYTASYAGTAVAAPASASRAVLVLGLTTTLTIATNASSYVYGAAVTVTVHLGPTHSNRTVSLYEAPYHTAYAFVGTATVNASGNATFRYVVGNFTTFPGGVRWRHLYSAVRAVKSVAVGGRIIEYVVGSFAQVASIWLFHLIVTPQFAAVLHPSQGACLRFEAQYLSGTAWYPYAPTSACLPADPQTSIVLAYLSGPKVVGREIRVRATFSGGVQTPATTGPWLDIEFRA